MRPERRRARSDLANAHLRFKRHPNDPAAASAVVEARRDYAEIALAEHIRATVDAWPPLTTEQRDRLAVLLKPTSDHRGAA